MAVGFARPQGSRVSRLTYRLEDRIAEFPVLVAFIGRAIIHQGLTHSERTANVYETAASEIHYYRHAG